jgi:hypothetical protein
MPDLSTPEATARSFEAAFAKGDFRTAVACVEGGVYSSPVQRFEKLLKEAKRPGMFKIEQMTSEVTGDTATVRFRVRFANSEVVPDSFSMRRKEDQWRIVPEMITGEADNKRMASIMVIGFSQPMMMEAIVLPIEKQKERAQALTVPLQEMKEVGLSVIVYMADHDEMLPAAKVSDTQIVKRHLKRPELLARFTYKSGIRWRINPHLRKLPLLLVDHPERIPMVYEEVGEALGFQYNDRALVAMLDGSVQYVSREEAKKLIWKPKIAK